MTVSVEENGRKPLNMNGVATPEQSVSCKKALRKEKIALRRAISPVDRVRADSRINDLIRSILPPVEDFSTVVGYVTDGSEPDLTPIMEELLAAGKILCLPRFLDAEHYDLAVSEDLDFQQKKFGIPEPSQNAPVASAEILDQALWLIPGVAFDENCNRLGRGKGVYDRLLSKHRYKRAIGIFYECQKCPVIPADPHDKKLDAIVTENAVYSAF